MKNNKGEIALKVVELRKKTGLTQIEFSKEFGVKRRTLQNWEGGYSTPNTLTIKCLEHMVERWVDEHNKEQ